MCDIIQYNTIKTQEYYVMKVSGKIVSMLTVLKESFLYFLFSLKIWIRPGWKKKCTGLAVRSIPKPTRE